MTKGFPRMNSKQKEYCPSGYIWLTNYSMINIEFVFTDEGVEEIESCDSYIEFIKEQREKYGSIIVTDAFDIFGRPLKHTDVAIYVLHPGFRRVQKTLRILKAKRDIK